jgi:hypothetical protein
VFAERGWLRVVTSPAAAATISVAGVPCDDWGMWTDLPAGSYEVCFGTVDGSTAPGCQMATVSTGSLTTVTGDYFG